MHYPCRRRRRRRDCCCCRSYYESHCAVFSTSVPSRCWLLLSFLPLFLSSTPATPLNVFVAEALPGNNNAMDTPVVVSGCGPAGLTFAHRYLQLYPEGRIHMIERRPKPTLSPLLDNSSKDISVREHGVTGAYAFGFGLGGRPRRVLEKIGLEESVRSSIAEVVENDVPIKGLWMVNRADLCALLLQELEQRYNNDPSRKRVTFTWNATVQGLCDNEQCVVIENGETTASKTTATKLPYSLLVAADGTNSNIRKCLVKHGDVRGVRYVRDLRWKALALPSQPNLRPRNFISTPGMAVLPRRKDRFSLLFFFRKHKWMKSEPQNPFDDAVRNVDELKAAITKQCPNITAFPPDDLLEGFLTERPGKEGYMKLDRHAVPRRRVALVGDAASTMYSRLGQGCASAMQGAALLAEEVAPCLAAFSSDGGKVDLEEALDSFSEKSVREGHAVTDLNLIGHFMDRKLYLLFAIGISLKQMASMLNDPETPYSDILRYYRWKIRIARLLSRFKRIAVPLFDDDTGSGRLGRLSEDDEGDDQSTTRNAATTK